MPLATDRDKSARKIVIIGAGAAGMMAAAEAAQRGAEVVLLEKNGKTGVKILMSGGTRCNITQDTDAKGILAAFGSGGRFLRKSVGAFGPADVVSMFHRCGVETKVEPTGKIFPRSNRALHVRDALENRARQAGAAIHLRAAVESVARSERGWCVHAGGSTIECDRLIVTAGGKSWPGCGTTGDAYAWLQHLGHRIVRTRPALVPLVGGYRWTHELSGLTLDDCVASVVPHHDSSLQQSGDKHTERPGTKKVLISRRSSLLFTHIGFSGPAAMDVSGTITAADRFEAVRLAVDLVPDLPIGQIEQALSDRSNGGRQSTAALISRWLPNRLAETIVTANQAQCTIAELPRRKKLSLVRALKSASFPIQGTRGFAKAEVTAGGVELSEVDPKTMESRLAPGLFIAGEVLNLDGWIGGYNFQAAFSTGRAAGIAASG